MKIKSLTVKLAALLCACGLAFSAWADSIVFEGTGQNATGFPSAPPSIPTWDAAANVAEVTIAGETTQYTDLHAAVAAANASAATTITLLKDVTLTETIEINRPSATGATKALTFDLNGHNITATDCRALWVKIGYVKVDGSGTVSSVKTSGSAFSADSSVVRVGWVTESPVKGKTATFELGASVTVSTDYCYGVTVFGNNVPQINNTAAQIFKCSGTVAVTGTVPAISGNGTSTLTRADITINAGATVSATSDYAIYFPQRGTLTVNGTVTGQGGVEMKAGTLKTSATTIITATGTPSHPGVNNNGTSTSGYAVAFVENNNYYGYGSSSNTFTAGTFNGTFGFVVDNELDSSKVVTTPIGIYGSCAIGAFVKEADAQLPVLVSGGLFGTEVPAAYVAPKSVCKANTDPETSATYPWTVVDAVAQIGDVKYETLAAAIDAAQSGDTVTLLADVDFRSQFATASARYPISKSLTLDGANHTIQVAGRGFGVGMNATSNVDVTFKDVTIVNASSAGRCIDTRGNLASLTLDHVTLDTTGCPSGYNQPLTIGGNQATAATVTIKNGSVIQTNNDGTAYYAIITFNPVNMTITDSTIKGWACIYAKGPDGSAGSAGSVFTITDSALVSKNVYLGKSNAFGLIVTEDDDIDVSITGTTINIDGESNIQAILTGQSNNNLEGVNVALGEGNVVTLANSATFATNCSDTLRLQISGGTFNIPVPENCCADGCIPTEIESGVYGVKEGDYVARIGTVKYETLAEAMAAAQSGDTVTLLADVDFRSQFATASARYPISKSLTIDGDNHTIQVTERGFGVGVGATSNIDVTFKNVTITNAIAYGRCVDTRGNLNSLTLDNAKLLAPNAVTQPLTIGGNQATVATVVIKNGSVVQTMDDGSYGYAITTFNPVNMTVTGSTIKGWACFNIKGPSSSAGSSGSTFTIVDSTLVTKNVYAGETNEYGLIKVEDVDIDVVITGTTINIDGDKNSQAIVSFEDGSLNDINISLGDGNVVTFVNDATFAHNNSETAKLAISGGTFNVEVPEEVCAAGYIPTATTVGDVTTYGVKESSYVAQIVGGAKYESLAEAVAAAEEGDTITLLKNITYGVDKEVEVWTKAVNLDLGGFTLTTESTVSTTAGNNGYKAAAICYSIGGTEVKKVTVSNGTIVTAYGAGIYADDPGLELTLSNLTINAGTVGTQSTKEYSSAVRITYGSKVIIESGIYSGPNAIAVSNSGGRFVVKGGTFTGDLYISHSSSTAHAQTVTITGGQFTGSFDKGTNGSFVISGGKFSNQVQQDYCATSCSPTDKIDGWYTVTIAGEYEVEEVAMTMETQAEAQEAASAATTGSIQLPAEVAAELTTEAEVTKYKDAFEYKVVESTTEGKYDVVVTLKDTVQAVSTDSTMEEKTEIEVETIPGLYYSVETSKTADFTESTTQEMAPEMATAAIKKLDVSGIEPDEGETVKYFKVVTTATSNGTGAKKESKTFGVMKTATPATKLAIIAVPWQDAAATSDTRTVKVSSMIKTEELAAGTKIHVAKAAGGYNTWKLGNDGKWVDLNAVVATTPGQEAEAETGVDASNIEVPQGGAFWVEQEDPKPIVMIGQVGDQPTTKTVKPGSNLCASPKGVKFDLNKITNAAANDTIVVPVNSGEAAKIYQRKNGKWKYWKFTNGRGAWVEDESEIPAGTGFWYNRTGGDATINWE